jgi:hypothetical protein
MIGMTDMCGRRYSLQIADSIQPFNPYRNLEIDMLEVSAALLVLKR